MGARALFEQAATPSSGGTSKAFCGSAVTRAEPVEHFSAPGKFRAAPTEHYAISGQARSGHFGLSVAPKRARVAVASPSGHFEQVRTASHEGACRARPAIPEASPKPSRARGASFERPGAAERVRAANFSNAFAFPRIFLGLISFSHFSASSVPKRRSEPEEESAKCETDL